MSLLTSAFVAVLLSGFNGQLPDGQGVKSDNRHDASVSGRVTIGDRPAVGVQVALVRADENPQGEKAIIRATTDQDGHYLLGSLASGYYTIAPLAPTMASEGEAAEGRRISLQESMKLENVDFTLVPGGVITGRVTGSDGFPISDLSLTLKVVDEKGQSKWFDLPPQESETDDRGIYRIYGLPPGRYIIGFGAQADNPSRSTNMDNATSRQLYPVHYYPGVLDDTRAKTIEVTAGEEITGIDIHVKAKSSRLKATGTVVDADTDLPIPGAVVDHGMFGGGGDFSPDVVRSGSDGRFKLASLRAGKHFLTLSNDYSSTHNYFSDRVTFEITDSDIDGLELRVHRGSVISGIIVSASPNDEKLALANCQMYAVQLTTNPVTTNPDNGTTAQTGIAPDRSFRFVALPAGSYRLGLISNGAECGLYISYIDVPSIGRLTNRAPYPPGAFEGDPIMIGEGQTNQEIRGVRVAVGTPRGVIRGQLKFEGGTLPPDALMSISIVLLPASDTRQYAGAAVDPDGRFVIKSLSSGEYLITASAYNYPPGGVKVLARASETVTVADGQETTVTLTLNLGGKY